MSGATSIDTAGATQDEGTMAVLAHAFELVGGWIAPLVIFCVKRQSRLVSFRALQVLFLQLIYAVVPGCLMVFWFSGILLAVLRTHGGNNALPLAPFFVFPFVWLGFMQGWARGVG
jgi:hypothetical protein